MELKMKSPMSTTKKDIDNKYYQREEAIKRLYLRILKNSNIPPKFSDASFNNFNLDAIHRENLKKVEAIKNYGKNILQAIQIPQSIYIFSKYNGCGKTHLAISLLKHAAWQYAERLFERDKNLYRLRGCNLDNMTYTPVFFMSEKNYLYKKKLAFNTKDLSINNEVELIERMVITSNILVIDDFLKERNTDFTFNELTAWICLRYEQNKPVIFTSNMDFKDMALENEKNPFYKTENFKNATYLASRISEMTKGYQFYFYSSADHDYRQNAY